MNQTTDLAQKIQARGIAGFDALHLALATAAQVGIFLTTDDRLVRRSARMNDLVTIPVSLQLRWLEPIANEEEGEEP